MVPARPSRKRDREINGFTESPLSEWSDERERPLPIAIPHEELSEDTLRAVVESFVLREGTDYGARDVSHEEKVAQVIGQLERREAQITFDPADATINIVVVERSARRGR